MKARGEGGSIINIASILGLRQAGGVMPYAVSKAGAIQMTKALALEWARFDIRVNALAPGYLDTELNSDFWDSGRGQGDDPPHSATAAGFFDGSGRAVVAAGIGRIGLHDGLGDRGRWRASSFQPLI